MEKKITLIYKHDDSKNIYFIDAINKDNIILVSTSFKIKIGCSCYLMMIKIIDDNYAHQGLGTKMLKFMEYLSWQYRCYKVEGKFYHFGNLGDYAKDFYTKNGYRVSKEYYDTEIYKRIDKIADIEKNI